MNKIYTFTHKDTTCSPGEEIIDNRNSELDHRLYSEWAGIHTLRKRFEEAERAKAKNRVQGEAVPDFVTIQHYRRKADPDCTNRLYVAQPFVLNCTVAQQYASCHFVEDFRLAMDALKELYPHMVPAAEKIINDRVFIPYNICVLPYGVFMEWSGFVLKILGKVMERLGDYDRVLETVKGRKPPEGVNGRNDDPEYQARIPAFLSERLSTIYFLIMAGKAPVFPMKVVKEKEVF